MAKKYKLNTYKRAETQVIDLVTSSFSEAVSEFVEEGDLNTFFLVVQQLFGCPLHAHIMAASVVTLFQWRLNSMLLQENEILLGVKDQIESLINKLDAVGSFTRDVDRILGRDSYHPTWASELRGMLCEAEDFVDDFVIKVFGQTEKDREDSIAEFGNELQNINSRVSEILNRRPRLEASLMLEEIHRFVRSNFVFDEDKETALASCMLNYINLPYDLKLSLLFYCAFLGRYGRTKGALVQVLVAAGFIQEKPELMEEKAQENIEKLMNQGMLEEMNMIGIVLKFRVHTMSYL